MYQNVRGLRTKLQFFHYSAINLLCNLLFLSEAWLNNDIYAELGLVVYNIFRIDKMSNLCSSGGIELFTSKKNLNF
jgi:hypothetical protein